MLTFSEAQFHPHMAARQTLIAPNGVVQAAPAPRFSRTAPLPPSVPGAVGAETNQVLAALGYSDSEIAEIAG